MTDITYRGRFAPSPTGPLHFGSLIAATASYLEARSQGGEWWLRIEDIDPPREVAGASDAILRTLDAFGFEWDGPVTYQSQRHGYYADALAQLRQAGLAYPCACSRKDIAQASPSGLYPGTCRNGLAPHQTPRAWRLRVPEEIIEFVDKIQGPQRCDPVTEAGDFVLLRADGYVAYQLATGFDDAEQGMTEVVRGADLLDSTPRQRLIQALLGLPSPGYAHHPVAVTAKGEKLSKQTFAPALNQDQASPLLYAALQFLGQAVPPELQHGALPELWAWARENWKLALIPQIHQEVIEIFP
ncbi:MAG: tRNA glutamyl-Q(34) synthetase GluQRS [Gammaproteobacteria bacterium]|nr:tRNA glutamyl-Q(34) synthetase GluQRS [Gammaproteobacteria bacterium]